MTIHNGTKDRNGRSEENVRNLQKSDLIWLVDDSVKVREFKLDEVFAGNGSIVRSERVKLSYGELNQLVVKLAPIFYDGASETQNRAGDVGVTIEEKHKPSDQEKQSQNSKT